MWFMMLRATHLVALLLLSKTEAIPRNMGAFSEVEALVLNKSCFAL